MEDNKDKVLENETEKNESENLNQPVITEVEHKIRKQLEKNKEKFEGKSRIMEYLKTEHKWENYVFLIVSLVTLILGTLMLTDALVVRSDFPVIGQYPDAFAWILVIIAGIGTLYALYPFFKPAFPEFKKISWLSWTKFLGNAVRVFLFLIIFALLFLLYDAFISQILGKIM